MCSSAAPRGSQRSLVLIDLPSLLGTDDPPVESLTHVLRELVEAMSLGRTDLVAVCCSGRSMFAVQAVFPACGLCLSRGADGEELIDRWPPDTVRRAADRLVICSTSGLFADYAALCARGGVECVVVPGLRKAPTTSDTAIQGLARPLPLRLRVAA